MASGDSQESTVLRDDCYDDPSQLSQLLKQRAGSNPRAQYTTSTSAHASVEIPTASTVGDSPQQPPEAQSPRDPALRRVPIPSRYVKPGLPKHPTAPTSTGFVMERGGGERMFQSMTDAMNAPGDTQPDSQMHREWTSGLLANDSNENAKFTSLLHPVEEEDAENTTDGVEPVGSSQEQNSPTITNPTIVQDDELEMRFRVEHTSPLRFETPVVAGRKRDSQGQILSSAIRTATTPGTTLTAAFFGPGIGNVGNVGKMSLTQVFNATQAQTSPVRGAPSDDPVFQRPSPNFIHVQPSSPIAALSSPVKAARSDPLLRSSSEPRAEYVTMKESQEQRRREHQADEGDVEGVPQDSWDEPPPELRRAAARKAKERIEREAGKPFASITAPPRQSPFKARPGKKRALLSLQSEVTRGPRHSHRELLVPDGDSADELSEPTPFKPVRDDSLDEVAQEIPSSVFANRVHAVSSGDQGDNANKIQVPNTSSHPRRAQSGPTARNSSPPSPSAQFQRQSQRRTATHISHEVFAFKGSGESVTIMDSQPDANAEPESVPRPRSLLPSSPSSNHYSISQTTMLKRTGFTSQVASSSMPPFPPRSSSQTHDEDVEGELGEEDRVPSSPPALGFQEITYDEHARGEGEGELHTHQSDCDDVVPGSDDGNEEEEEAREAREMAPQDVSMPGADQLDDEDEDADDNDENLNLMGKDDPSRSQHEEQELIHSSHQEEDEANAFQKPLAPPGLQRQSTVPESDTLDMLEDTQPSAFGKSDVTGHDDTNSAESAGANQTNSTEPFQTAREQQSESQNGPSTNDTSANVKAGNSQRPTFRSLEDIAAQPETQHSQALEDIDIPKLSYEEDMDPELSGFLSGSSPVRPAKKRKITYSARKFKGFTDDTVDSDQPIPGAPSSPLKQIQRARGDLVSSDQEREEYVVQDSDIVSDHAGFPEVPRLKSKVLPKPEATLSGKKGALKPVSRSLLGKHLAKSKSPSASATRKPQPSPHTAVNPNGDNPMPDRASSTADVDELSISPSVGHGTSKATKEVTQYSEVSVYEVVETDDAGEEPGQEILFPTRVIAPWPGKPYYPATCVKSKGSGVVEVSFDMWDQGRELEALQLRSLEFRIGDVIKVDAPGMKKSNYVVVGFKNKISIDEAGERPLADRRGYGTVVVELKARDSLPATEAKKQKMYDVPMSRIYLTPQLWVKLHDRTFDFTTAVSSTSASGVATPASAFAKSIRGPSMLRDTTTRAASVASSGRSGIFATMVFAITFTSISSSRETTVNAITSNGGEIVEMGFHEMFDQLDASTAEAAPASASTAKGKGKAKGTVDATGTGSPGLVLRDAYRHTGFVALITDDFSRRTKYFQALALNVPCLHFRWVADSISSNALLPWSKYLLPAGLSLFLAPKHGVVRSRTMDLYDPSAALFSNTVEGRGRLLDRQSVLLVMGASKAEMEKKQPYLFLTHALGPAAVHRCPDLTAARRLLTSNSGVTWDWVYVEGGKDGVADAAATLSGSSSSRALLDSTAQGKKRKRDEKRANVNKIEDMVKLVHVGGRPVKITCDEFVIQSLILGALVD